MSHTNRRVPLNASGMRHPHTTQELRQLKTLQADARVEGFTISPPNRINRHIPTSYSDLKASSFHQLHTA